MRCPICEREFDPAGPTAARPFCSSRCRTIDLGRWLGEGYSLASDPEVDPADRPKEGANGQGAPGQGD